MRNRIPDPADPRHGTHNGYGNLGCRCDRCREANRLQGLTYRRRQGALPMDEYRASLSVTHGTRSAYNKGCRCDDCRETNRLAKRRYRARTAMT